MFRRFGLLLAALAIFSIAGGHWAVLQTVAWAGMLRDYAQRTGSVAVAWEQTFDGEHPCEFCHEIAAAKAKEQKQDSAPAGTKDNAKVKAMVADTAPVRLSPPAAALAKRPALSPFGTRRAEQPPTPPPRRGARVA